MLGQFKKLLGQPMEHFALDHVEAVMLFLAKLLISN
jgi:hypothetical protein